MSTVTIETIIAELKGLRELLAERDRRMEERFISQQQALIISSQQLSEYKSSANEWRQTLSDSRAMTVSRSEYEAKHQNLLDRLDVLGGRVGPLETVAKQRVSNATIWLMAAGVFVSLMIGFLQFIPHAVRSGM